MNPIIADIVRALPKPADNFKSADEKNRWWKVFESAIDYLYPTLSNVEEGK